MNGGMQYGGPQEGGLQNMLMQDIQYQTEVTGLGAWRRFMYPNGMLFEEFVSHRQILGLPLLHYTRGKCPQTGKRITAKGVIAIGRFAFGILAIGHISMGVIAVGQVAIGLLLGLGQATTGFLALGQLTVVLAFGIGQFALGNVVIAQFGFGQYVLAQLGFGRYVWDMRGAAPEAQQLFEAILPF
jgi:hypothetical protein